MAKPISAFVPYQGDHFTRRTIDQLLSSNLVYTVYLLTNQDVPNDISECNRLKVGSLFSSDTMRLVAKKCSSPYALFIMHNEPIEFGQHAIERLLSVAENSGSGLVYSDYYDLKEGKRIAHPVIDYQPGSIRDDFNFGPIVLLNSAALNHSVLKTDKESFNFAGFYSARLAVSRKWPVCRISEFLYAKAESDVRKSGERLFDYVDPRNRAAQIEMELAATRHLKKIGAYLKPGFKTVNLAKGRFACEASIIIPVKNRVRTIREAVESALKQKADFPFNIIVVDNHSADGTTDILGSLAQKDARVLHVIPQREDLGIGGCWNEAIQHEKCGQFAVQLDSDDLYKDETTLHRIVDVFKREKCAMVIGSYQMVNFALEEIPPGIVDHREWTADSGPNNALRINGLGAPRAFYTPVIRKVRFPNVNYGEDYAVGLAISREYRIGRIYDPIYLCRRWEGNSDADLDIATQNLHDAYKDKLRTLEIMARAHL